MAVDAGSNRSLSIEDVHRRHRPLQQRLEGIGVSPVTYGNQLHFVSEEDVLYEAARLFVKAKGWVALSAFDWKADAGGLLLPEAMEDKAEKGQAFLGLDGYGSRNASVRTFLDRGFHVGVHAALSTWAVIAGRSASQEHFETIADHKGLTTSGRRLSDWMSGWQSPFHMHRKSKVASDLPEGLGTEAVAMVDGSNLSDDWLVEKWDGDQKTAPRYDSGFIIRGPAVWEIAKGFVDAFAEAALAVPFGKRSWTVDPNRRPVEVPLGDRLAFAPAARPTSYRPGGIQVFTSQPAPPRADRATLEYLVTKQLLESAQQKVTITTPMMQLTPEMLDLIRDCTSRNRNVQVEIITNGPPMKHAEIRDATITTYEAILATGARIFEVTDRELHDKSTIVDGIVVRKGSGNFNIRSMVEDLENGAVIYDLVAVRKCVEYAGMLRSHCREVVLNEVAHDGQIALETVKNESRGLMSFASRAWGLISNPLGG